MDAATYQAVFNTIIVLLTGLLGSPITQAVRLGLNKLFKTVIDGRWALVLTGIMAAVLAVADMLLSSALNLSQINQQNFPTVFFAVFSLATFYFGLFKGSEGFLGRGFLLKK
jgi:hypothetical protein